MKAETRMPVNSKVLPQKRVCEKCGQHEGDVYSFYYGKIRTHTIRRQGHTNIHTIRTQADGIKEAAACDMCIRRRRIIRLVIFLFMVIMGAGVALLAAGLDTRGDTLDIDSSLLQAGMLGVAGILGLLGLRSLFRDLSANKEKHGENLIIAFKKGELRKQGFKYFWNN